MSDPDPFKARAVALYSALKVAELPVNVHAALSLPLSDADTGWALSLLLIIPSQEPKLLGQFGIAALLQEMRRWPIFLLDIISPADTAKLASRIKGHDPEGNLFFDSLRAPMFLEIGRALINRFPLSDRPSTWATPASQPIAIDADLETTRRRLMQLGWSEKKVSEILRGPQRPKH